MQSSTLRKTSLTESQMLVYQYLKEKTAANGGRIQASYRDIADGVTEAYADVLRRRVVRRGSGDKISIATVSRAIKIMEHEGIIEVIMDPLANANATANIAWVEGQADEEVVGIMEAAHDLGVGLQRIQRVLARLERESYDKTLEVKQLHKQLDESREEVRRLLDLNQHLQKSFQGDSPILEHGKIVGVQEVDDNLIAYIVQVEKKK